MPQYSMYATAVENTLVLYTQNPSVYRTLDVSISFWVSLVMPDMAERRIPAELHSNPAATRQHICEGEGHKHWKQRDHDW